MKEFSKKYLINLGNKIRQEQTIGNLLTESLSNLQSYRTSYKNSLSDTFNILIDLRKKVNRQAIITYRIKRLNTIINKLERFPRMELGRMWDIAGCRIILNNDIEVYKFKSAIEQKFHIRKTNDYILNPKENGYKSLHLYIDSLVGDRVVEVQIRNRQDHNWATLVEISDLLFNSGLKELQRDKKLLEFHKLLSNIEELTINDKIKLAKINEKYDYLNELNKVFSRNYLKVRSQWLLIEREYRHRYILIESSKDKVPKIEAFDNFNIAEEKYFEKFELNSNANVVLTHLPKPNYEQISIAYSNYILTMHSFVDIFTQLYETLIIESLKKGKYLKFRKYFNAYYNISIQLLINIITEAGYSVQVYDSLSEKDRRRLRKKEKEWRKEIERKINKSEKKLRQFQQKYSKHLPKKRIPRYITRRILKRILNKYSKKLKKNLLQQKI